MMSNHWTIEPVEPTIRDRATGLLADILYAQPFSHNTERKAYQSARDMLSVADFSPVVGTGLFAGEIADEAKKGNVGTASVMLGAAMVPVFGPKLAAGARGMLSSGPNLLNRIAQSVPTDQGKDFYSLGPIGQNMKFGSSYGKNIGEGIKESTDPIRRAKYRETGLTEAKRKEIMEEARGQSSANTAISMGNQVGVNPDSLVQQTLGKINYLATNITNLGQLKNLIGNGARHSAYKDVPDVVVDRAFKHITQGPHQQRNIIDKGINPSLQFKYQVKDPLADGNVALREASGTKSDGANLSRFLKGNSFKSYETFIKKTFNKSKLSPKDIIEVSQISATLNDDVIKKIKQIAQLPDATNSNLTYDLLQARARVRAGKEPSGKNQKKLLNTFDSLVESGEIKLARLSDEAGTQVNNLDYNKIKVPDGHIFTQQSFVSSMQKELGGMNNFYAIDPKKKTFYSMTSDGHDIFGINPPTGSGLVTVSPLVKVKMGQGVSKFNRTQFNNTLTRKTKNAVKLTKERTGIKKSSQESNNQYIKRALGNMDVTPSAMDIRSANISKAKLGGAGLLTGGAIGTAAMSGQAQEEEQR